MNPPDPLELMYTTLVSRHGLRPAVAWDVLVRAARRKGVTVVELCDAMYQPAMVRR